MTLIVTLRPPVSITNGEVRREFHGALYLVMAPFEDGGVLYHFLAVSIIYIIIISISGSWY